MSPGVATESLLSYLVVAAMLTLTPGPNMALVIRTAVDSGFAGGLRATLGVVTGLALWGLASAVGVAAILAASPAAFTALQAAGGLWLIYLGVRAWLRSGRLPGVGAQPPGARREFGLGLVTNFLNPMVGAFYLAALPGFVEPGESAPVTTMLLAGIHIGMVLTWLTGISLVVARGGQVFTRPGPRQFVARLAAVMLAVFGLRTLAAIVI
jgi:threonine/homoserine/homoserine lactone efflux protein